MINRIVMSRVEPCFWGNRPANGEVSKVKKNTQSSNNQPIPQNQGGVDTFTSSENSKKVNSAENKTVKAEQDKK